MLVQCVARDATWLRVGLRVDLYYQLQTLMQLSMI